MANNEIISMKVALEGDKQTLTTIKNLEQAANNLASKTFKFTVDTSAVDTKAVAALAKLTKAEADLAAAQAKVVQSNNELKIAEEKTIQAHEKSAQATEKTIQASQKLETEHVKLQQQYEKTKQAQERTAQATEKSKQAMTKAQAVTEVFGNSIGSLALKMVVLQAKMALITAPINAIKEAFSTLKAVDSQLTTIQKVSNMSASEVDAVANSAYRLASAYGKTADSVLEASVAFTRAGYREQIEQLSELTLLVQNVGDVESELASTFLIATDAAWGMNGSYDQLLQVVDGMNAVANNNATSIEKLAEAVSVAGSTFATTGEDVQTFTALVGTGTAVTQRSGSEVARALRTIMMNIRQVKGEVEDGELIDGESIAAAATALRDYANISTMANGELRKGSEVLDELAQKWNTLDSVAQSAIAEGLAGKRQANVLMAIMSNYDMYQKQLIEYSEAAGTAAKANEIYLDSWEAKTNQLSATWTEFVQKTINSDTIKGLIDVLIDVIDYLDNLGNTLRIIGGLVLAFKSSQIVGWFQNTVLGTLKNIGTAFSTIGTNVATATTSTQGFTAATEASTTAMTAASSAASGWLAIIGLVITALSAVSTAVSEGAESRQEAYEEALAYAEDYAKNPTGDSSAKTRAIGQARAAATALQNKTTAEAITGKSAGELATSFDLKDQWFLSWFIPGSESYKNRAILDQMKATYGYDEVPWYATADTFSNPTNLYEGRSMYGQLLKKFEEDGLESTEAYGYLVERFNKVSTAINEAEAAWGTFAAAVIAGEDLSTEAKLDDFIESIKESTEYTDEEKEAIIGAAEAQRDFTEEAIAAAEAQETLADKIDQATASLEAFNNSLDSESDDAFQGYVTAFEKFKQAMESGLYGSNAFQNGLRLFLDEETISKIADDYSNLGEIIQNAHLEDMFGDAEDRGRALLDIITSTTEATEDGLYTIKDGAGETVGAVKDLGDSYQWFISDKAIPVIAEMTGLTEDAVASMIGGLQMFSEEADDLAIEVGIDTSELEEGVDGATTDAETLDDTEAIPTVSLDTTQFDTAYQNVMAKLERLSGTSSNVAVTLSSKAITNVKARSHAKGTQSFDGGTALVNDEAPADGSTAELIVQNGEAFIANGGMPSLINLDKGAQIFTASQTREILGGVPSFAGGTVLKSTTKKKSSKTTTESIAEDTEKIAKLQEKQTEYLEAIKDLETAKTERTVRYYNSASGQWEWMADQKAIANAEEAVAKAKSNLDSVSYDSGGVLDGMGIAIKATNAKEAVLPPSIMSKVLEPSTNTEFTRFVTALGAMLGMADGVTHSSVVNTNSGNTINNRNAGDIYVNGVKIGADMLGRPLSDTLRVLALHNNN